MLFLAAILVFTGLTGLTYLAYCQPDTYRRVIFFLIPTSYAVAFQSLVWATSHSRAFKALSPHVPPQALPRVRQIMEAGNDQAWLVFGVSATLAAYLWALRSLHVPVAGRRQARLPLQHG
jgi:hypothetical protein